MLIKILNRLQIKQINQVNRHFKQVSKQIKQAIE
jgi:hypothetical protein